jgi:hypothetical protein
MTKTPEAPKSQLTSAAAKTSTVDPWGQIAVGDTVLYCETKGDGWYECTVLANKDGKLSLQWRDYKLIKPFDVKPRAVAILSVAK